VPCAHWTTLAEAALAADEILADVFGIRALETVHKDDRNIATREGFDKALRAVVRELLLIAKPADQAALKHCLHALDVNWKGLTEAERDAAIARAANALGGVPDVILEPVIEALAKSGKQVVTSTKDAAIGAYVDVALASGPLHQVLPQPIAHPRHLADDLARVFVVEVLAVRRRVPDARETRQLLAEQRIERTGGAQVLVQRLKRLRLPVRVRRRDAVLGAQRAQVLLESRTSEHGCRP
jgi:hypothetical protein